MDALTELIKGYLEFYRHYLHGDFAAYREWVAKQQAPKVMVIACSDSRITPSTITHAGLGQIFQVCNVANLVPPYRPGKDSLHSTSAALEYAVNVLKVEHIVVLGHSNCGGIRALLSDAPLASDGEYSFIATWIGIASEAKARVAHLPTEARPAACEEEALKISLRNLESFPWIAQRMREGTLKIHAWHFDVASGILSSYAPESDSFVPLV